MLDIINTSRKLPVKTQEWPWRDHRRARFLREVEGMTWPAISKEMGIAERTLQKWAEKEVWKKKGEDAPKVEEWTRERFLELAAKKGMPKARAVELLIQGMTKPSIEVTEAQPGTDEDGNPLPPKIKELPDYATRHKFQKDYWVLAGLYSNGSKQMEINNNNTGTVNVQVIIPEKSK